MTNQSNPESKEFSEWADMFPRMSSNSRATAWEAWQAALSRQPAQTVSEQPSQPSTCECHGADECAAKCQPEASKEGGAVNAYAAWLHSTSADYADDKRHQFDAFKAGYAAALSSAQSAAPAAGQQPALTVWYGPMPESNGKSNFTAILMRKDGDGLDNMMDGFTIDRSEYPDRVRYEADRVRYLLGELEKKPFILDYDADKHSGYKQPAAPAAAPEGWQMVPMKITEEMHAAAVRAVIRSTGNDDCPPNVWAAMLAAAPQPVAAQVGKSLSATVADALRPFLSDGQKVIWREPFRWHDDNGVLPNHYEMFSVEGLAADFGYTVIENCGCAAIIAAAHPQAAQDNIANCQQLLMKAGKPHPRTCVVCKLGPCKAAQDKGGDK